MKYLIILGDGMADEPIESLDNLTPLQYASTPAMDLLARKGKTGLLHTIPEGMHPGSEVANLSVLGYDPVKVLEGRGALEAASMGIDILPGEMVMRCNLICIENGKIKNHSAGHISSEEAGILIHYLNEKFDTPPPHEVSVGAGEVESAVAAKSPSGDVGIFPGVSYRHILKLKGGNKHLDCTPPHDIPGTEFRKALIKAQIPEAQATAGYLNNLIIRSQELLENHPVNLKRKAEGKDPANSIWPWSPGYKPQMKPLSETYPIRTGAVISAVDLIKGIGIYAGLENIDVPGATGLYDTNYEGKAQAALKALQETDFVYVHVEASDEAGHEGDAFLKVKTIEYLDNRLIKPILETIDTWDEPVTIALLPDHPTPCRIKTHTDSPVPFVIYKPGEMPDEVTEYNEFSVEKGKYGILKEKQFIKNFFRKRVFLFMILFLSFAIQASANSELDSIFQVLFRAMNNKDIYVIEKEQRLSEIKNMLNMPDLTDNQRHTIYNKLYDEYCHYKVDSAVYYQELNLELAGKCNNPEYKYTALLNLSFSYWIKGRFLESMNIMDNLDRKLLDRLPEWLLVEYYESYERLYMYYAAIEGNSSNEYYRRNSLYRDSLLKIIQPNTLKYNIVTAEKLKDENKTGEAKKFLMESLKNIKSENHDKAIVANIIADIYKKEGNVEMQKKYCAISAICDIKNAVKENTSMMALALLLYGEGNIDEAYKCIKSSMDDAVFCNAYFRAYELSKIFPIIDSAYQEKTVKQRTELQKYLLLVSILSVFLIFAMIYVYRQMKRIAKIRKELHHTNVKLNSLNIDLQQSNTKLQELNGQLSTINQKLTETNRVKEAYLGKFIDLCSNYIEKLDNYRRSLNKTANSGKIEDLLKSLKSSQFIDDELSDFYTNFDETFLRIYPTFITDFNALFPEEEKQVPKQRELLNTELRIYALIRLGINDSAQIAVFLRYSITTVYTYRSKLKNKSFYPENFEERIMQIGSPVII